MKGLNRTFLPISFDITGKTILIPGGSRTTLEKISTLQRFTDRFAVVAWDVCAAFEETGILV